MGASPSQLFGHGAIAPTKSAPMVNTQHVTGTAPAEQIGMLSYSIILHRTKMHSTALELLQRHKDSFWSLDNIKHSYTATETYGLWPYFKGVLGVLPLHEKADQLMKPEKHTCRCFCVWFRLYLGQCMLPYFVTVTHYFFVQEPRRPLTLHPQLSPPPPRLEIWKIQPFWNYVQFSYYCQSWYFIPKIRMELFVHQIARFK